MNKFFKINPKNTFLVLITHYKKIITPKDRIKLIAIVVIQISLSVLDVIGVALIGIVGSLAVSGLQSKSAGGRIGEILNFLGMQNFGFQEQVAILSGFAVAILIGRTLISIIFIRKTYRFFSHKSANLSSDLTEKILSQNITTLRDRTLQETIFSITSGVTALMMGTFANAVNLVSDLAILIFLTSALFIVDPIIAMSTAAMFLAISILMNKLINTRAQKIGLEDTKLQIESNSKIAEVITSFRELFVANRIGFYSSQIRKVRHELANLQAEMTFMPNISKYIVETTVILGALLVAAIQFSLKDAPSAFATLSVFVAAATRLAPALLRLQQGIMHIRNNFGAASSTLDLITQVETSNTKLLFKDKIDFSHKDFNPSIRVSNLTYTYPNQKFPSISEVELNVAPGSVLAIVGKSGAGKTTLVDLILGLLEPKAGSILISGVNPRDSIEMWPGAIAYVPQDINIFDGTIKANIALGYLENSVSDTDIERVLEFAVLKDMVSKLPLGVNTLIGENGTKLSGGQRQRLGLARALFSQPKLLVLDEATSSLDADTEKLVSDSIARLSGEVTLVVIAHRLSTVRSADLVCYMDAGKIKSIGTFELVRSQSPEFDKQAKLLGL